MKFMLFTVLNVFWSPVDVCALDLSWYRNLLNYYKITIPVIKDFFLPCLWELLKN